MNYFLFKLSFHTPCHFGSSDSALSLYTSEDHFCADTLFSALCHTARTLYGNSGVEALIEKAQKDQLFLSDAMPWCGERYYLPRPFLTARTDGHTAGADRKAMKIWRILPWRTWRTISPVCAARGCSMPAGKSSASVFPWTAPAPPF